MQGGDCLGDSEIGDNFKYDGLISSLLTALSMSGHDEVVYGQNVATLC